MHQQTMARDVRRSECQIRRIGDREQTVSDNPVLDAQVLLIKKIDDKIVALPIETDAISERLAIRILLQNIEAELLRPYEGGSKP